MRDYRFKVATNLDDQNVDLFSGQASFVDPHTIKVEHPRKPPVFLSADVVLIACGSRPYHPPQFNFDGNGIYDPNTFMRANYMPKSLAVVGAGPTGCEYACIMALLGCSVSLIDAGDTLLPFLDFRDLDPPAGQLGRDRHRFHDSNSGGKGERGTAVHALARRWGRPQGGRHCGGRGPSWQHGGSGAGECWARERRARSSDRQRELSRPPNRTSALPAM